MKILISVFTLAVSACATELNFVPVPGTKYLDLVVSNLGTNVVGAYEILITSSNLVLEATSQGALGLPGTETLFVTGFVDAIGKYRIQEVSLLTGGELELLQGDPQTLVRVYADALPAAGGARGTLILAGILADANGNQIDTTFGTIEVDAVPEPGAWLLAGLPLLLLLGRREYVRLVRDGVFEHAGSGPG